MGPEREVPPLVYLPARAKSVPEIRSGAPAHVKYLSTPCIAHEPALAVVTTKVIFGPQAPKTPRAHAAQFGFVATALEARPLLCAMLTSVW